MSLFFGKKSVKSSSAKKDVPVKQEKVETMLTVKSFDKKKKKPQALEQHRDLIQYPPQDSIQSTDVSTKPKRKVKKVEKKPVETIPETKNPLDGIISPVGPNDDLFFTLRNIDMTANDKKYNMDELSKFEDGRQIESGDIKTTIIETLGIADLKQKPIQTMFQDRKITTNMYLIPLSENGSIKPLPETTTIPCFGCHRVYSCRPLIVPMKCEKKNSTFIFHGNDIVCSFNCMYSVLQTTTQKHLYIQTPHLILKLYHTLFSCFPNAPILPAPDWRLRKVYGGVLDDNDFQNSLQVVLFRDTQQVIFVPAYKAYEVIEKEKT